MKVKQLINILKKYNSDMDVYFIEQQFIGFSADLVKLDNLVINQTNMNNLFKKNPVLTTIENVDKQSITPILVINNKFTPQLENIKEDDIETFIV